MTASRGVAAHVMSWADFLTAQCNCIVGARDAGAPGLLQRDHVDTGILGAMISTEAASIWALLPA